MDEVLVASQFGLKAAALAHFSYEFTKGGVLLTDLQGWFHYTYFSLHTEYALK